MRNFSDEPGRTRVFVEAYRSYSADGNPRRTPLSGKRAIYGWKRIKQCDLIEKIIRPSHEVSRKRKTAMSRPVGKSV
jgi:hypothetical protein